MTSTELASEAPRRGGVRIRAGGASDRGLVRDQNEDRFLVDAALSLFVVADGLGGHRAGEVAAQIAVETIRASLASSTRDGKTPRVSVQRALIEGHSAIHRAGAADLSKRNMGSTAALAWLPGPGTALWIGHVGDSRAYLLRGGELRQLTEDHTLYQQALHAGDLPNDPEERPSRSQLSQALGSSDVIAPEINSLEVYAGDRILLCSDGLTNMLASGEIAEIAARPKPPQSVCEALIDAANDRGGHDNITAVLVSIEAEGGDVVPGPE